MTGILSVLGRAAFRAPGAGLLKRIDPAHRSLRPGSPGRSPQVGPGLPILRVGCCKIPASMSRGRLHMPGAWVSAAIAGFTRVVSCGPQVLTSQTSKSPTKTSETIPPSTKARARPTDSGNPVSFRFPRTAGGALVPAHVFQRAADRARRFVLSRALRLCRRGAGEQRCSELHRRRTGAGRRSTCGLGTAGGFAGTVVYVVKGFINTRPVFNIFNMT